MTDQPLSEGIVHGVVEDLELPPEPPPSGPWLWVQENLIGGDTLIARLFNGILSVVFTLLALKILQFITSYIFNPERRWGAVTFNMKLLMVQAFPRADMFRIWLSVGIFFVLVAWSLVAYNLSGRISLYKVATGTRAIGVFLMLLAIMHSGAGASKLIDIGILSLDSPGSWSGGRWAIFLLGLLLTGGAQLGLRTWGDAAKETTIPFLSLLVLGMAAIVAVIFTVKLPFPDGPFGETIEPIASTTRWPWTILFALTVAAYFIGKGLVRVMGHDRFKRVLLILWVISYPIIIMVIQRKPILEWNEIAGFGSIPFLESPLGLLLAFGIIGGAVIWSLAWPKNLVVSQALAVGFGLAVAALPWLSSEAPLPIKILGVIAGLGVLVGGVHGARPAGTRSPGRSGPRSRFADGVVHPHELHRADAHHRFRIGGDCRALLWRYRSGPQQDGSGLGDTCVHDCSRSSFWVRPRPHSSTSRPPSLADSISRSSWRSPEWSSRSRWVSCLRSPGRPRCRSSDCWRPATSRSFVRCRSSRGCSSDPSCSPCSCREASSSTRSSGSWRRSRFSPLRMWPRTFGVGCSPSARANTRRQGLWA